MPGPLLKAQREVLSGTGSACPQLPMLGTRHLSPVKGMGAANRKQSKPWKGLWFGLAWQDTLLAQSTPAHQALNLRLAAKLGGLLSPLRLERYSENIPESLRGEVFSVLIFLSSKWCTELSLKPGPLTGA